MSIRRAYNIVRQKVESDRRLTFEEFAILCRLELSGQPIKTSQIAEYQGALRPTMTHRTNHLAELSLIERGEGTEDRRNVVCSITDEGRKAVKELSTLTCAQIPNGRALSRTSPERLLRYVDAMGAVFCKAGDLILLCLAQTEDGSLTITELVNELGFLQPTVSMSVSSLEDDGMVWRDAAGMRHMVAVKISDAGRESARQTVATIGSLVVRRSPRTRS